MIRLFVPLAAGIILQVQFHIGVNAWVISILSFLLCIACFTVRWSDFQYRWLFGIMVNLFLIFAGIQLVIQKEKQSYFDKGFSNGQVIAAISASPEEKEKTFKIFIHVIGIKETQSWKSMDSKALIYVSKDTLSSKLELGSLLLLDNRFSMIKNKRNPNELDIQKYYAHKGIYQSGWFPSKSWKLIGEGCGNPILIYSNQLRNRLLKLFVKLGCKGDDYSVLSALTLGYVADLDDDIKKAYIESGTMHVLSVSGLHVAIVFMVINYLLFFMSKNKGLRYLKALICILLIWGYAVLSGSSSAVLRSALMISFVVVGTMLKRPANIFNTLAASAFILLIYDPFLLLDVSFQLSYLAVFGIVLFQPVVYHLFETENWILDKIWALTSVSLAAQLGTVPISLFYFHQFPNYFIFANMLIIPLTSIIIYLTVILFGFSGITLVAQFIGKILFWLVHFTNASVRFIESLPFSVTRNIFFDTQLTLLLYVFIFLLTAWFIYKYYNLLRITLCCIISIILVILLEKIGTNKQQQFIVFNIPGVSAANFIKGHNELMLYDTCLKGSQKIIDNTLKYNRLCEGITKTEQLSLKMAGSTSFKSELIPFINILKGGPLILFGNKRIVWIRTTEWKELRNKRRLKVNYIILSNNLKIDISTLLKCFQPDVIIIDSSNKTKVSDRWLAECNRYHIKCHVVETEGAFVTSVN